MKSKVKLLALNLLLLQSFHSSGSSLSITHLSDIDFGTVYAGSGPHVVEAGSTESAENASFKTSGDKHVTFTIILPKSVDLFSSSGNHKITISDFTSYPSGMTLVGESGSYIYVGATINSIPLNTPPGQYAGNFVVELMH